VISHRLLFLTTQEFIGGGCLQPLLVDADVKLDINQQLKFMVEIANGVTHLHQHNLIHR
jgi:serine/threonine protein kinase